MNIRAAVAADAAALSIVLENLVAAGKRSKNSDAAFALGHYIAHPHQVRCSVATDDEGRILGFQSLKHAFEGNPYSTPMGWGIIGTHVMPSAARQGVGSGLFASTVEAAHEAGLSDIEAYISAENKEALAYYEAMGFRTYREPDGTICKAYKVE